MLVAGGIGPSYGVLQSAEIYDPLTNSWTLVSSMDDRRFRHTANELLDGSILITGGVSDESGNYNATDTAERLAKPRFPPRRPGGRQPLP